jgi:hypothetical protein
MVERKPSNAGRHKPLTASRDADTAVQNTVQTTVIATRSEIKEPPWTNQADHSLVLGSAGVGKCFWIHASHSGVSRAMVPAA